MYMDHKQYTAIQEEDLNGIGWYGRWMNEEWKSERWKESRTEMGSDDIFIIIILMRCIIIVRI